jgi:hypothetical protein
VREALPQILLSKWPLRRLNLQIGSLTTFVRWRISVSPPNRTTFAAKVGVDILGVIVGGSKTAADERGAVDAAVSIDDCLQRRNELVSNFMAGFVSVLKKRDPEV